MKGDMMFYCDECREKKNRPESLAMSIGLCEICGNMRSCWNVQASNLPNPEDNSKHTGIDCPICGREFFEFFVGDIINTKNTKKLNSHDALLDACKEAQEKIYQLCDGSCPFCDEKDYPVCGKESGYDNVLPEDAEEWRLDHLETCLVTKIDNAIAQAEKQA